MKYKTKQYALALYEVTEDMGKKELPEAIKKFVSLLKGNNDLRLAEKIEEEFNKIYNEKNNIKIARVESASKLQENVKKEIIKIFKEATGKDIILEEKIDESLIGGFRIRMDDILLDASIKNRLVSFKNKLIRY